MGEENEFSQWGCFAMWLASIVMISVLAFFAKAVGAL